MSKKNAVTVQRDITDRVNEKVSELQSEGLTLPDNYNYSNALKSAFFTLQDVRNKNNESALQTCTTESIANTLLDMVTQGLSPAKNQCYFVAYGNRLQLQRSYFGTQAVLKRLNSVKDIWSNVIFEGDDFEISIDDGRDRLKHHTTSWVNRDNEIIGAYAVIKQNDDDEILTVMTKKEIQSAWNQSKTSQGVHKKFPQEMAKRTVINRAAKNYINTSDDSDLLVDAINRSTENEYENGTDQVRRDVTEDINQNANKEVIDFDEPIEVKEEPIREPRPVEEVEETPEEETEQGAMFDNLNDLEDPGF